VALAAVALVTARRDQSPSDAAGSPAAPTVSLPVGDPMVATLDGGAPVTLRVDAELPPDVAAAQEGGQLDRVPLGAPVTLSFELDPGILSAGEGPQLDARLAGGSTIALERHQTFLVNRAEGTLLAPNLGSVGAVAGDDGHDGHDGHDHAVDPGQELAQTMPGGGLSWATTVTAGPDVLEVDPTGRWLATGYQAEGRVELVDLLRREPPVSVATGVATAAFTPDGTELWVADAEGTVTVVDPATGRATGTVEGARADTVTFDHRGRHALFSARSDRTVRLFDVGTRREQDRQEVGAVVAAGYAESAGAFVTVDDEGTLTMLPVLGDGSLGETTVLDTGTAASDLAVAPDGRTAVVVAAASDEVTIVDLAEAGIRGRADAADPVEVVFLEHFAVVRSGSAASVTWVDLEVPSRSNDEALGTAPAASLSVSADGTEVLAVSPDDDRIFHLHTMMGRPMVMEQQPNTGASDVVIDVVPGLFQAGDGVFRQRTVLDRPGRYTLRLQVGAEEVEFDLEVAPIRPTAPKSEPVEVSLQGRVGEAVSVRFRVEGDAAPRNAVVVAFASTPQGPQQLREPALIYADGTVGAEITTMVPGTYQVWLVDESAGITPGTGTPAVLEVTADAGPGPTSSGNRSESGARETSAVQGSSSAVDEGDGHDHDAHEH
jgi:DNA-binding beta-propeller fold protein YncE